MLLSWPHFRSSLRSLPPPTGEAQPLVCDCRRWSTSYTVCLHAQMGPGKTPPGAGLKANRTWRIFVVVADSHLSHAWCHLVPRIGWLWVAYSWFFHGSIAHVLNVWVKLCSLTLSKSSHSAFQVIPPVRAVAAFRHRNINWISFLNWQLWYKFESDGEGPAVKPFSWKGEWEEWHYLGFVDMHTLEPTLDLLQTASCHAPRIDSYAHGNMQSIN